MSKNKIAHKTKRSDSLKNSQYSGNTQQNFVSVNQLSSIAQIDNPTTISNIRRKHLMQNLINRLKFLIAPSQKPKQVIQNWNIQRKTDEQQNYEGTFRQTLIQQISYNHTFWQVIKTIQALCSMVLFWVASTQLVYLPQFQTEEQKNIFSLPIKISLSFFVIFSLVLKQILIIREKLKIQKSTTTQQLQQILAKQQKQNHEQILQNIKDYSRSLLQGSMCLLYIIIHAFGFNPFRLIIQTIISCIFFYKSWNLRQMIEHIYNYIQAKDLKKQYRLMAIFALFLLVSHLIALILYVITYIYPNANWMTNHPNNVAANQHTWFAHYICSIYFAVTTMATVGYGDFTPVQVYQMLLVSAIQLFGTALFGYMLNIVGLTVSEINTKNQEFQNHISTIHKLQNHYQISRQLCQKFKQDIVKNQSIKKQTPLSQNQQVQFFKMIQNTLKEQFILQTNIRVIKKSIFFLTHFTVNFQNQIALKLIRKIYKKNQKIPLIQYDGQNQQRCMLIINTGSVDIQIQNQSSNTEMKKFIKNICPQQGKPTLNVFGYSALILNRDINLSATTKDVSVIYLLKRKDVLEGMDKNMLDFEGIAELRESMLQYKNINSIEAPTLRDIQKHFIPNIFLINKKKKTISQKRNNNHQRANRKSKIKLITARNYQFRTMVCIDLQDQILHDDHQESKRESLQLNNSKLEDDWQNQQSKQALFITKIEQFKDYQNFMRKSNISNVLPKYHQYLKQIRRQKKFISNVEHNNNKMKKLQNLKTNRLCTYTQGMNNKKSSRADKYILKNE